MSLPSDILVGRLRLIQGQRSELEAALVAALFAGDEPTRIQITTRLAQRAELRPINGRDTAS